MAAVAFTGCGVLPLFLVSAQILQIDQALGFGVAHLAIAAGAFMATSALTAGPAGGVVARVGPTRGLRLGACLTLVSSALAASAAAPWLIPVATGVGGVGNGLIQVAANLAIFDGVRAGRQGVAYGMKQAAVPLASVLAGASLPLVGLAVGWRWGFMGAALLGLVLAVVTPRFDTTIVSERAEAARGRVPAALLPLAMAGFTGAIAGNGVALFVVPSAVEIGISEAAAGAVLAACSSLVVGVRVGVGWFVDRRDSSGHLEMMALSGTGAIGALILMTASVPALYLVALPLTLLGTWGWPGVFFFTVVNSFAEIPARASGLVLAGNFTGTLLGPVVVGLFAARGDYRAAWLFVGLVAAASTAAFLLADKLWRRRPTLTSGGGR